MKDLCYHAYLVACFVLGQDMGSRSQMEFLEKMYNHEYEYLPPRYKQDKKLFVSDVLMFTDYLIDKDKIDAEFPAIERDFQYVGKYLEKEDLLSDYSEMDMFFMLLRLRILFANKTGYARMKLRTLLKHYGYKRRSSQINERIRDCLLFYHIQTFLRDGEECDIREIDIDDMITFRIL